MRPGPFAVIAPLLALALWLAPPAASPAAAASAVEIDAQVATALARFYDEVPTGRELAAKAKAMLVFPSVVKAGLGIGGEYGQGALRVGGRTAGYYRTVAASIGLQIGAQSRSEIILFMTEGALAQFQASDGFQVGVDGSIALIKVGIAGEIDTTSALNDPVIGFIYGEQGLMANLSLEGTKISKLEPSTISL
jgi:lipid-binding SYLF domain-containing protein